MSCDQNYPIPEMFPVDRGGRPQCSAQPPGLVPCWSFPAAQERMRSREKSRGFMGVSPSLATVALMLFLLVFAALGFVAYQLHNMQTELAELREMGQSEPTSEIITPQKQIGDFKPLKDKENRLAAHVIGRIEKGVFYKPLRWEAKVSRAFISGGVTYRIEDGGLQVNESGLFHIYSRVELIFKSCSPVSSFVHTVFVRRKGHPSPLTLMDAHRAGYCSHQTRHPWTSESYLGSAVQLHQYDTVFVNVSHPDFLSHGLYGNFFGLYKI